MRRSRTALTLFLSALAASLQFAGWANVQTGMAIEPPTTRLCSHPTSFDCFAGAPGVHRAAAGLGSCWAMDTCHPDYDCYGDYGADCYHGPLHSTVTREPVLRDAEPIEEYVYGDQGPSLTPAGCESQWDCDECDGYVAHPVIHKENLSDLAADPRHSTGQHDLMDLNAQNDGLSPSYDDCACDLPADESCELSHRLQCTQSYGCYEDGELYDDDHYSCSDWYGGTGCRTCHPLHEPSDLPVAETELHVAKPAPAKYGYEYDYGDDYGDGYNYSSRSYSYGDYESDYAYDDYSAPYASRAYVAPAFTNGAMIEPADLPVGEHYLGDLPPGEELTDDLPAGEDIEDDLPPGELTDDLPPAEPANDLPPAELQGEDGLNEDWFCSDLPPCEDISDLPPGEFCTSHPASLSRTEYRNEYESRYSNWSTCEYNGEYNVECYGDYGDYSHCDGVCHSASVHSVATDYSAQAEAAGSSLRPLLRTASWLLNEMGEALKGLSQSCDQIVGEEEVIESEEEPADYETWDID